jgi:hypothetical protein
MFKIDKMNKIFLTKGDSCQIEVRVFNKDGVEVEILPTDKITLTVRKNEYTDEVAFSITADLNTIYIKPAHTTSLSSGLYVYDIQFEREDDIQTIIPLSYFQLGGEITR